MASRMSFLLIMRFLPFALQTPDEPADLYALLAREGITQFRYQVTSGPYTAGAVTITFLAYDNASGAGWRDALGNGSVLDNPAREFVIEGPTARIVSPANGGEVDFGVVNGRNYLDVTFENDLGAPLAPAGYTIDPASITDLQPEFTLSGPGRA